VRGESQDEIDKVFEKVAQEIEDATKGTAQYQAQNILCFFYNECDYYLFYSEDLTKSPQKSEIVVQENILPSELKIYPNPAANWVMIELSSTPEVTIALSST